MHLFILLMNFLCVKLDKQLYFNLVPFHMFFTNYILLSICVLCCYNYSDTAYNWNVLYYEILSRLNNVIVLTFSLSYGCVPAWIHRSQ